MSRRVCIVSLVSILLGAGVLVTYSLSGNGHTQPARSALSSGTSGSRTQLFDPKAVADLSRQVEAEDAHADAAYAAWSSTHRGAHRDDFLRFALDQLPPPPEADHQRTELAELARLASTRTPELVATAAQYDRTGEVEIWDGYAAGLPQVLRQRLGDELQQAQSLADKLSATAKKRFARPSPYEVDPALRPDKSGGSGKAKVSYPSSHATFAYAQADLLARVDPAHASTYVVAAGQVAYSRLYMAGHYRSDVLAGALLGRLIADYEADAGSG